MKVRLVFDDWRNAFHESVYQSDPDLSMRSFHSGTTFSADIELPEDEAEELKMAMDLGFVPVFYMIRGGGK